MNDFNVPYYIMEEIIEYIEQTAMGKNKSMKWENVKALLKLAVMNKKITKEQSEFLEKQYCRENKSKYVDI